MEDTIQSLFEAAKGYLEDSCYDQALLIFDKILRFNPRSIDALNGKAKVLYFIGEIDKSLEVLGEILKIDKNDIPSHYNSAKLLVDKELYTDALEHYDAIIKIDDSQVEAFVEKAKVSFCIGNHKEGLLLFDQAILRGPESKCDILLEKANALVDIKNYVVAIDIYKEIVELDPKNPDLNAYIASCYKELGNLEKVKVHYEVALSKINFNDPKTLR